MSATNYTPIQLYYSTTASAAPTSGNLANGELAINITDGKLYYKDNGGVVQVIATKGAGSIGGSTTQIQYNNAGALAGNAAMTFNSGTNTTTLTTLNLTNALGATYGGTAQSAYTQGDILYSSATNTLSKLGIGTVNYILTSSGSVPQWVAPTSITVSTATNLAGGAAGSVPYQSGIATTTFLAIEAADRVMTSSGSAPQWVTALTGLTGLSSSSITNTSLTSGRVVLSTTAGLQADSANLTFNGATLSTTGLSSTGFNTLVKTLTLGNANFNGAAVFAAATPAKLYIGTGTVTDVTSAASATNTTGAISSLDITPIAATNTAVTYTNASTLYIAGAPSAGTNITITNPYSLYIAAGAAYLGGAITLNGGTANGVAYLNGSKVLTTGTALTFDGSKLLVSSTGEQLKLLSSGDFTTTGTGYIRWYDSVGAKGYIGYAGTANQFDLQTGPGMNLNLNATGGITTFSVSNAEQMRLTSIGLGIGTSSPIVNLDVVNASALTRVYSTTITNPAYTQYRVGSNITYVGSDRSDGAIFGAPYSLALWNSGAYSVVFGTNNVKQMTLDNSGNLGLGVTPSAWGSQKALDFAYGGLSIGSSLGVELVANTYWNGSNWIYRASSTTAQRYEQDSNGHKWYYAPSGTAGTTATFTQAMTLDASNNWIVGDTAAGIQNSNSVNTRKTQGDLNVNHITGAASGSSYINFGYAGGVIGSITQSGTTAVLYNVTSDQRLKENIVDADSSSSLVDALQVRQYDWKADGSHQRYGFIAQELVTVAPEAVHQPADPEEMMAVDYSKLVPMLVKEIQDLRKRLAAAGI